MRLSISFLAAVAAALTLALAAGPAFGSPGCADGRTQFSCTALRALVADSQYWAALSAADTIPIEIPLPVGLANPALRRFWQYETAGAASRAEFEFYAALPAQEPNFETAARPLALRPPAIRPHGVINRRTAGLMTRLLRTEATEAANLYALDLALDRSTAAKLTYNRPDWAGWQLYSAAGFARRAAAALRAEIPLQRAVSAALVARRLLLGLGPADLVLDQRKVRAHGLVPVLRRALKVFGITSPGGEVSNVLKLRPGPTYDLSRLLGDGVTLGAERASANQLAAFAASVPRRSRPTTPYTL
jgi:hypothetical protein